MSVVSKHHVFVYGTLRTGQRNWQALLSPQRGTSATTASCYTMRCVGNRSSGGYPILECGGSTTICGEVFEVDDTTLRAVDQLEGHPDWYCREEVTVRLLDGHDARAWIYLMPEGQYPEAEVVESGDWVGQGS